MRKVLPIAFVLISFAIAGAFIWLSASRNLSTLENTLLQVFTLAAGLIGSYGLGKQDSAQSARDLMKPHARSAFRRLMALYGGVSRIGAEIQASRLTLSTDQYINSCLSKLEGMVTEQIATAADALEDWNDIVPDEVQELRSRLEAYSMRETNDE